MLPDLCTHLSDLQLDLYALGRLPEPEAADLEEHLLMCGRCSQRLTETDHFIVALRHASAALDPHAPVRPRPPAISLTRLGQGPALMMIAAAVFVLVALAPDLHFGPRPGRALSDAVLLAVRGAEPGGLLQVAPARVTTLGLDLTATGAVDSWRIKVVNYRGVLVWNGSAQPSHGLARIRIDRPLASGNYWVRLYDAAAPAELVREYGFAVR